MIDPTKTRRTRDGREVRIYATDHTHPYTISGAVSKFGAWEACSWTEDGQALHDCSVPQRLDLVEVRPRIQRDVWVNVYPEHVCPDIECYNLRESADIAAAGNRIACVKLTIDCEEGQGL